MTKKTPQQQRSRKLTRKLVNYISRVPHRQMISSIFKGFPAVTAMSLQCLNKTVKLTVQKQLSLEKETQTLQTPKSLRKISKKSHCRVKQHHKRLQTVLKSENVLTLWFY